MCQNNLLYKTIHVEMGFVCISLRLCSSQIAWDNYAPLQMISEYFPARGRPLNSVKKPTLSVEFEHVRNKSARFPLLSRETAAGNRA